MSYFLVPTITTGADVTVPKYIDALNEAGLLGPGTYEQRIVGADAANGASAIVFADTTPQQDSDIAQNADAILVPPLDNTIPNVTVRDTVRNAVEALNMPAQWIVVGMSYRTILRVLIGISSLLRAAMGIAGVNFTIVGHLNDTVGSFPLNIRNALAAATDAQGIDRSTITGSTLLREALRNFGQQFANKTIHFGDL